MYNLAFLIYFISPCNFQIRSIKTILVTGSCPVPSFNHGIIDRQKEDEVGVLYCADGYFIKWKDGTFRTSLPVDCYNDKWYFRTIHREQARDCEKGNISKASRNMPCFLLFHTWFSTWMVAIRKKMSKLLLWNLYGCNLKSMDTVVNIFFRRLVKMVIIIQLF